MTGGQRAGALRARIPSRSCRPDNGAHRCVPTGGELNNPDCDGADGFACYGTSPTDASAFCTVFGCTVGHRLRRRLVVRDGQPGAQRPDEQPFVRAHASRVPPAHVLLPVQAGPRLSRRAGRDAAGTARPTPQGNGYCSTECATDANCALDATCKNWQSLCTPAQGAACQNDEDCPLQAGVVQHCDGARCTPECGADSDCVGAAVAVSAAADAGDAQASAGASPGVPAALLPAKCEWRGLCTPRAGVCLGNGGFCSPCRSDADCTNGYCISGAPYSTERFCSAKSSMIPCDTTDANPAGCPTHQTTDHWVLNACVTSPVNQCEGFVLLGSSTGQPQELPGCWTANR